MVKRFLLSASARTHRPRCLIFVALLACVELHGLFALGQTSTWTAGAGGWAPCPQAMGTALWDTCSGNVYPDGSGAFAVVDGGPVTLVNGNGISVSGLTVSSAGSVIVTPGYLDILGSSIVNNGSIINGPGNGLAIDSGGTTTLSGSGSVTIQAGSRLGSGILGSTLVNQQMIQGQGALGFGTMGINNQATISASGGQLSVQPSALGLTNTGLMKAQSGSTLDLIGTSSLPYANTGGTIQALDGGLVLVQTGITGGTLTTTGTGNFTLSPPGAGAQLTSLTNAATFNIPAGAGIIWAGTINNTGVFNFAGQISISGTVTLQGSGNVQMTGGQWSGGNSNPLTNQQLIHGYGSLFETPLTNQATVSADSKGNTLSIDGGTVNNTSILEASAGGTLKIDTVVNNSGGKIEALGGSTIILTNGFNGSINGGTLTTTGTGVIESQNGVLDGTVNIPTNAGKLSANNFDLYFQGTIHNTGTITLSGNSCIVMNQPSTLTGTGKVIMSSASCIYGSGLSFTNKSTIQGSGTIGDSNPMPIINNGSIIANQANTLVINPDSTGLSNTGKLVVNAGSTMTIKNFFNNLSATGTLTGGTYSVSGILNLPNSITANAASITLTGLSSGILFGGSSALSALASNATQGSLSLQNGQTLTTSTNFTNAGKTIVGASSSFKVGGSYTQSAGSTTVDGTLTAPGGLSLQKGTLVGKGTVAAAVTSNGAITAGDSLTKPAKLPITGSYTQEAQGVLNISVGGTGAGTFGELAVSNGVVLGGTLTIKLINGFVPAIGDSFTIVSGSAVTGQFAKVNGESINSSEHFQLNYSSTAVTLAVVSGP